MISPPTPLSAMAVQPEPHIWIPVNYPFYPMFGLSWKIALPLLMQLEPDESRFMEPRVVFCCWWSCPFKGCTSHETFWGSLDTVVIGLVGSPSCSKAFMESLDRKMKEMNYL